MTPQERQSMLGQLDEAQVKLNAINSVSADEIASPAPRINMPTPVQPEEADMAVANNVRQDIGGRIQAQSEEARQLREMRQQQAGLSGEGSLQDLFTEKQSEFGVPQNLRDLKDIQLQLADLSNESVGVRSDIARAAGQTVGQASREITAETARNNVRSYGLAARAAVLQGNIETAAQLASQAVQFAYQDRTLRNTNLINQINSLQSVVDGQTAQLLRQEERAYQADQTMIKRVQESVDSALQIGATASEVARMTDPNATDGERLALAQMIQARGATEMRDLQMRSAQLDVATKAEQLARLREPTVATRDTSVIEVGDQKQLVDTQTGEIIATFGAEVSTDEIEIARDINFTNTLDGLKTHPGLNSSVGSVGVARIGIGDAFGNKDDFVSSVENVLRVLTLNTFAEAKEKGMTFGAMSEGEWDILSQSATKIAETRVYEKEGIPGFRSTTNKVKGYDISESDFLKEFDRLSNFAKVDALRKGASPEDVGVLVTDDGKHWTRNSDRTLTELPVTIQ